MSDEQEFGFGAVGPLPDYPRPEGSITDAEPGEFGFAAEFFLPSAVMLARVEIGGVRVESKLLEFGLERVAGQAVNAINMSFSQTLDTLVALAAGQTLEVWRGWNRQLAYEKIFSGKIERFDLEGGKVSIIAKDNMGALIKREVNHVYDSTVDASAGKISEIFKDIVTTYGGLTADAISVQDSGTTVVLSKFVCNRANVLTQLQKLAAILDWHFYYRADTDKVYFEARGYTNNDTTLTYGANVIQVPKWVNDTSQLVNDIYVSGGEQLVETTESFAGPDTVFTLAASPVSTKVYVNSVLKEGGVAGSSPTADYYVDKEKKTITFAESTSTVEVRYTKTKPIQVHTQDAASISTYGRHTRTFFLLDVRNPADASSRANAILARYKDPFISSALKIRNVQLAGLTVGQAVPVVDVVNGRSGTYTVNRHLIRFPSSYDEIQIGAVQWNEVDYLVSLADRLKSIEEESLRGATLVTETVDAGTNFTLARFSRKVETRLINNTFLFGHPANSVLSGSNLLGDHRSAWSTSEDVTF